MFEDVEYTKPAKAFKDAGHSLIHIGIREGQLVKGKRKRTPVKIDKSISDVKSESLDAILIPGGCSPDHLRGYKSAVNFIKDYFETGKPIFAICHAPQILITAQVLKVEGSQDGNLLYKTLKMLVRIYIDNEVVEDDNLISSSGPPDIPAFIKASLKRLE